MTWLGGDGLRCRRPAKHVGQGSVAKIGEPDSS
jgi:hypothetical protein